MKKIFLVLLSITFLFSCKKEYIDESQDAVNQLDTSNDAYEKIKSLGFLEKSIRVTSDYYVVDGDILFPKKQTTSTLRHARTEALVSFNNQTNIKIKIDASIPLSSDWRQAVSNAITNWNNIPNCRLTFSLVTSAPYDILVKDDSYGVLLDGLVPSLTPYPTYYPVAAGATYPSNGNPGNLLLINLDMYPDFGILNIAQKTYNISHNIGHCVGFLHTDMIVTEGSDRVNIPGTSPYDQYSIMNYQDLTRSWTFSPMDITAIQTIYGNDRRRVCLKTLNGGYYVQAANGGGGDAVASSLNPWAWETFSLIESPLYGGHPYYVLQCKSGYYLQAVNGGGGNVVANSSNPWEWETFELVNSPLHPGKYVLKTKRTGHYLQAVNGGGSGLVASSSNPWDWETFTIINSYY